MKLISLIIILDGISIAFVRNPNGNLHLINLILGTIIVCIGISVLSKRKYSYYSVISLYIIRIIYIIYSVILSIIQEGFDVVLMFVICIPIVIYMGIVVYFKNRKADFR